MQWLFLILIIPYIYLLIRIYRNLKTIIPYVTAGSPQIFVTIIAACHNEIKNLPALLKKISEQDYSKDLFEVIIIDDNSSDETYSAALDFKGIRNLKVLKSPGRGKKQAIRAGIDASSGNFIISTDADCRPGKSWIRTIASYFEIKSPQMIICPVRLENKPGFLNRFQQLEFLGLQGITAGTAAMRNPVMCNGANLAFKKEIYLKHSDNLHPELASGDDVFLLHNIKKDTGNGVEWLESVDALVTTELCETTVMFIRQRARWISKAGSYNDRFTQLLAIVTYIASLVQLSLLIASLFNPSMLFVFATFFLLKSIPDFLILKNVTSRYGESSLLKWFLQSQLIYPFYVIIVSLSISSPFRRGT
ncbi:MAG: glycosyltransferase [Bacteroidales bacterium]|nr:glycosyltransferase [Bacteroidales bacterium]